MGTADVPDLVPSIQSPTLGFGASGAWSMPLFAEQAAIRVASEAIALGVRHFDTAGFYGNGNAERRLGKALAKAWRDGTATRKSVIISTKIGKSVDDQGKLVRDFRPDTIDRTLALSRERLGVDSLDILYMHGPNKHELVSCLPHLLSLKDQGIFKAIGVCSDGPHLATAAKHPDIDVIMGRYNLLDRVHASTFRIAKENGKIVVAIAPLAQALWRNRLFLPTTPADVWYLARAMFRSGDAVKAARSANWIKEINGWTPVELACAFQRLSGDVDVVITTTTRSRHLRETASALTRDVPDDIAQRLLNS